MKIFLSICTIVLFSDYAFSQTGNVGINTSNPTNTLHVYSTANPLRLEGLQTGSTANNLLTVDVNGIVKQNTSVVGLQNGSYFAQGTTSVNIPAGSTAAIPGVSISFTPASNVNALITVSSLPLPLNANANTQGSINLMQNGVKISSQYYSAWDGQNLNRLGNFTTTTRLVSLNAGTPYTFSVQAKCWAGTTVFNTDPVASGYVGAIASDADAMATLMTIVLFSR